MEQIKSTIIDYVNYPSWSDADKQKFKKRLLFYTCFFIFIACLYFLWVWLFYLATKSKTDGIRPLLHGRGLQSPGINYVPRLMNSDPDHFERVKSVHKDIGDKVAFIYKSGDGRVYSDTMDDFLANEGYNLTDYGDFDECNDNRYGFAVDKPCLFLRINKVVDWDPLGIQAGDIDDAFKMVDSNLLSSQGYCSDDRFGEWCLKNRDAKVAGLKQNIFSDASADYTKPFAGCMAIAEGKNIPIKTFPANGQFNWEESFTGADATQTRRWNSIFTARNSNPEATPQRYKTPLVAVQLDFSDDTYKNKDIEFHCFVFDRNMEIDPKDKASGMVTFYARVNKA